MPLRKAHAVRFSARGLSDANDATDVFPGASKQLVNLNFAFGNPEIMVCRPGVTKLTDFSGFASPTFVSVQVAIGNHIYGMVSTSRYAGKDEPFSYNVDTGLFDTVSNVLTSNVPLSLPTSGNWFPPTLAIVGTKILVAHAGFSGSGANFIGVIDISTVTSPAWSSSNLATNALPAVPIAVANFNNRAYYLVGNIAYFSDVLVPLTRTNASQSVTLGDTTPCIAMAGLPLQTTSSGVVQSLLVLKNFQIWQITGDLALSTLAINYVSLTLGTKSARSVVPTPYGVHFLGSDGPYNIDAYGAVRALSYEVGPKSEHDLQDPFIDATDPTRIAATFNVSTYRVCLNTLDAGQPKISDYWFDTNRRRWTGPHTWPYDCASAIGNYTILSHASKGAALFKSQVLFDLTTIYTDNGDPITFAMQSLTLPKDASMTQKQVVESTIELSSEGGGITYDITALDDQDTVLDSVAFTPVAGWSHKYSKVKVESIPWSKPLVFQKMAILVSGECSQNIQIGSFFARYQDCNYMNQQFGLGPEWSMYGPPVAAFSFITAALLATFTDESTTPPGTTIISWVWDFGDSSHSTAQNPTHTYATPGTYHVILTVASIWGSSSVEHDVVISPAAVTYDWETDPTSLAFTWEPPPDTHKSYFVAAGAGRGGTNGGVVLGDGFASYPATFTSDTLPSIFTHYDIWVQFDTLVSLTINVTNNGADTQLIYFNGSGGTSGWIHITGTTALPFNQVVHIFGPNVPGGSADVVMDDWTFS